MVFCRATDHLVTACFKVPCYLARWVYGGFDFFSSLVSINQSSPCLTAANRLRKFFFFFFSVGLLHVCLSLVSSSLCKLDNRRSHMRIPTSKTRSASSFMLAGSLVKGRVGSTLEIATHVFFRRRLNCEGNLRWIPSPYKGRRNSRTVLKDREELTLQLRRRSSTR